jgi:hypothetical protein
MMRMGVAAPRTYPTVNDDIVLGGFKVDGVRVSGRCAQVLCHVHFL